MLDSLRDFARTPVAKVLLAVLIVSFAAWGASGVIMGVGANVVARVAMLDITANDFQRAYQEQLNLVAQQTGQVPSLETAKALQIPAQVISRLTSEAALNNLGRDLGLGLSSDRLGRDVRNDPQFRSPFGGFSNEAYAETLRRMGLTETEFREDQTDLARRQQIVLAMFAAAATPGVAFDLVNRFLNDKRSVDYFPITTLDVDLPPEPTDADLEAMLAADAATYRLPERRTVDVITLTPEQLAEKIEIADEHVVAEYERTKANMVRPERRLIWQVALPDEAAATAFLNAKAAGRTFDQAVEETMLPVVEIGALTQAEIRDQTLAAEAFALAEGDFAVVPGATGQRVIHVARVEPGGQTTLDDARESLRQQMALAQARMQYIDVLDQIEELRAAFRPLPEIAERFGLRIDEVVVTPAGQELGAVATIPETDRSKVAQAVFAAQEGKLSPTVPLAPSRNVWFDLKSVEPARDQTLAEARAELEAAWFVQKANANLKAETDQLVDLLNKGYPIADVAASVGQIAMPGAGVSRSGDGGPVLDAAVANAIFEGGVGHVGSAVNGDGAQVIFKVTGVTPATEADSAEVATQLAEAMRNGAYSDFVAGLRDASGYSINQAVLDQQLAQTAPSAL